MSSINQSTSRVLLPENVGHNVLALIRNLCFALFAIVFLIFTIIAVNYKPNNTLLQPFTSSTLNPEISIVKADVELLDSKKLDSVNTCGDKVYEPIDCGDPDVFVFLMRAAMENFWDIEFYRFRKPVRGNHAGSCHMAWRYRPKGRSTAEVDRDYRSFEIVRTENCTFSLVRVGEYRSGENARNRKRKNDKMEANPIALPEAGDDLDDVILDVGSESSFSRGKYLIYSGGEDRCKSMNHYLWSFLCMLGEAQYLNRTLVMDLSLCLSKLYTKSGRDEEGKDFRFYFDFEHLLDSASVIDQAQFWLDWNRWQEKDGLTLHFVEDHVEVTPMKLVGVTDTLIMRKFGTLKQNNYWFQVCEGETKFVVKRPWHMIWKSRPLLDVASAIASRMKWDFDAAHVERGEKAKNYKLWPNLDRDTSPESLLATLRNEVDGGRELYIATNEQNTSFFDPLKSKYLTHFIDEHKDLWDVNSDWYAEMMKLNNGNPVEFDDFMRESVDSEVFAKGKRQIETFNDLTKDCKDGINTCTLAN